MRNSTSRAPQAHILVVEQNQETLVLLAALLASKGYRVTTAADGLDGLEKFSNDRYQLILIDLSTPLMSGWELGRIVKQREPSVPVALVTGLDFGSKPDHFPFDAIIRRPFRFDDLHHVVDSLIRRKGSLQKAASAI
ncbi:MAG: response regulator [Deltaproteobacteria bacterium]|nr:MAG: response regulator [Deltaproteobacteria bacterium]